MASLLLHYFSDNAAFTVYFFVKITTAVFSFVRTFFCTRVKGEACHDSRGSGACVRNLAVIISATQLRTYRTQQ